MEQVFSKVIPPKSGIALELAQGQHLRVVDLEGQQVVDMVAFNRVNPREKSSTAYTRNRYMPEPGQSYYPHDRLSEGDWIMSTLCRPLLTFVQETPVPKGVHGLHHRMCNQFYYGIFGGESEPREGCFEILSEVLRPYDIRPEDVPDSIDLFMNYPHSCELGHFVIQPPISKPGDYIEFRAEMDCIVGLSNCPGDIVAPVNAGLCTPVEVTLYENPDFEPREVLSPRAFLEAQMATLHAQEDRDDVQ